MRKSTIMVLMALGSFAGGYVPTLWGAGAFSMSSVISSAIGGILGIYIGFRITS